MYPCSKTISQIDSSLIKVSIFLLALGLKSCNGQMPNAKCQISNTLALALSGGEDHLQTNPFGRAPDPLARHSRNVNGCLLVVPAKDRPSQILFVPSTNHSTIPNDSCLQPKPLAGKDCVY